MLLSSWTVPLITPVLLVHQFISPNSDYSAGHRGVDFAVVEGAALLAPERGTIVFAATVAGKPVVAIQHANGYRTAFEPACSLKPVGTVVASGQSFGRVCSGGYRSHCFPALCLHFSLRHNGLYLSPLALIGGLSPSVLVK